MLPAFLIILTTALTVSSQTTTPADTTALEPGKTVEREIAGGETHAFTLTLAAGAFAHVNVDQGRINIAISVFVDGQRQRVVDNVGVGAPEVFSLIAERATTYRFEVLAPDKLSQRAKYALTVNASRPAAEQDKARVEAEKLVEEGMQLFYQQTKEARREAAAKFQKSFAFWQAANDKLGEARAYHLAAHTLNQLGDTQKGQDLATQGLPIAKASGDPIAEAYLLDTIGSSYSDRGDRSQALVYFHQALKLRPATDLAGRSNTLNNIGIALAWIGERPKALEYLTEVSTILGEMGDRSRRASVLGNLCVINNDLSDYQKAFNLCNEALQIKRSVGDKTGEATQLNNLGSVYASSGQYQKALDAYLQARDIHRSLGERGGEGVTLNNVAWVYATLGEYEKAIDIYNQALVPMREIKYTYGIAKILSNIAVNYADLKDFRKALEINLEVLPLRPESNDREGRAITFNNIAGCYQNLGDKEKALEYYTQAIALHRLVGNQRQTAAALRNIGTFHRDVGETLKAVEYLQEAREISRRIGDRHGEAQALSHLAKLERDRGNLAAAHKLLQEAISDTESLRVNLKSQQLRAAFLASARKYYELDIDVLMRLHQQQPDQGFATAAFQVSERGRARSLLEMLREARAEIRQGVDPLLIERDAELRRLIADRSERQTRLLSGKSTDAELSAVGQEIDSLTTEYEQLQARIRDMSPRYAALVQPEPLNLTEIQKQVLDADTLLLEYALGEEKSYAWAVTPDSVRTFALPARAEVEKVARRFYELSTERGKSVPGETLVQRKKRLDDAEAEYPKAAAELGRMLLGPVAAELKQKRLVIVGEGVLQYVPFAALPSPVSNTAPSPVSDAAPLIVQHEIVSLPSASVLAVLRNDAASRKPASKTVAVLADPVFSANDPRLTGKTQSAHADDAPLAEAQRSASEAGVGELMRLHFSRQEADEIARLAGDKSNLKAVDFAASRTMATNEQLGDYRIVHFATHGLINNHHPDLSGIVLSLVDEQGRPQNGFLRLYDIYNLKLNADLVVLSACQTALGKEIKGEGLVGLTRGFMYAGAPRVVASYWRIDDRATADIMKRFYSAMLKDGLRPAAALRAAQVSMLQDKRWQSPHYWAAFTVQGEWK
jgi:CHAT domain-containing protein